MVEILNNIIMIIAFIFYFKITNSFIEYIISSIFFVKPMRKKYDILASDIATRNIKDRYIYLLLATGFIYIYFIIIYSFSLKHIFFSVVLIIHIMLTILYWKKYKKYDILEYINFYSTDLFDWDKIYGSYNIEEDLKKRCFEIHNMDYYEYKSTYVRHLKAEIKSLQYEIDRANNKT